MPTFIIHQRGTIRGIPRVGAKKQFLPGDTYPTEDREEIATLISRPDYVATEILEGNENDQPVAPIEPVISVPESTELEIAHQKQAVKDELLTTSQRKLWERQFPDGSLYKSVWKQGMKKVEFVGKILERLEGFENATNSDNN